MRKIISSINMTLDGFCDHTAGIADDELHDHVNELFRNADTTVLGRKTYQLMEEGWPPIVKNPTGNKSTDEFALLMENITKIVFSRTLKEVDWTNARVSTKSLKEEVEELKKQPGKNVLVGGPSIIIQLMKLNLIDEYQFCIHPIVLGKGLPLFKDINDKIDLELISSAPFKSGAVTHIYVPTTR